MAGMAEPAPPASARILSSPALRCCTTAEALGRDFKIVPALAPDADPQVVLDAARWPAWFRSRARLVSHQPTLGQVAAQLLAGREHDWAVKGAVWWLRGPPAQWAFEVTLHAVQGPDTLSRGSQA